MNAGVEISASGITDAATDPLGLGVFLGLVVGKTVGIGTFTWLSTKLGFTTLPEGVTPLHMVGIAMIAGIGFTVSIFVTGLAFDDDGLEQIAKMAIIFASAVAAIGGAAILNIAGKRAADTTVSGASS
jgi:NhaA family Na+:H+ antiporter